MTLIMKFILLYMITIQQPSAQPGSPLNGEWHVIKVASKNDTLIPTMPFILKIGNGKLSFNTDANECFGEPIITTTSIDYKTGPCTRVCCDGNIDPIGGMDLYRGQYTLTDDTLRIRNNQFTTFLLKVTALN